MICCLLTRFLVRETVDLLGCSDMTVQPLSCLSSMPFQSRVASSLTGFFKAQLLNPITLPLGFSLALQCLCEHESPPVIISQLLPYGLKVTHEILQLLTQPCCHRGARSLIGVMQLCG